MALLSIFWRKGGGLDVHALRGQSSRDLRVNDLFYEDSSDPGKGVRPTTMPAVGLVFQPLFKGTRTPNAVTGDTWDGFGIHVNMASGVVKVDAAQPSPAPRNFIMEVTVTEGAAAFKEVIRVHIHGSVRTVWLTPATLAVRLEPVLPVTTNYRFTVRAEFDDGVAGDITEGHGVTWGAPADVRPAEGRLILAAGRTPGQEVTITATLLQTWGGQSATGKMKIGAAWATDPTPPEAEIIPGGGWPGTVAPDNVPNILFMGDGFASGADQTSFTNITTAMVQHLKTNKLMRPYDLLCTRMNWWRLAIPANEPGISVRCEVFTVPDGADTLAYAVPLPEKPPAAGAWEIRHLLYAVGLPLPADATTARDLPAEWRQLVNSDPTPNVTPGLVDQWKKLATRCFIDEVDNFPAMALGGPPSARFDTTTPILDLHQDRVGRDGMKSFFAGVVGHGGVVLGGGERLGMLWRDKVPAYRFDNTDLIVMISAYPGGRAANFAGYIATSTKSANSSIKVVKLSPLNNLILKPTPAPATVDTDTSRVVAHELGHSFGLNDEYAEFDKDFTGTVASLGGDANVTVLADVVNAGGQIRGEEIFWNWLRVANAGVVTGPITAVGGNFNIPVRPDDGFRFTTGKTVMLRERKEGAFLKKAKLMLVSKPMMVVTGNQADHVVVSGPVTLADLQKFPAGSLLFVPVPAPASARASTPFSEMVAKNIKDLIDGGKPLFARPVGALATQQAAGIKVEVPDLGAVSLPTCFKHKPRIVGLYEGGGRYSRKIYHPTGWCMMNQNHEEAAEFCAVCRHIMVDLINPAKHFEINLDYEEIYPLKE